MELMVKDKSGKVVETMAIPDDVFPESTNIHLLYLAVKSFLDNQRLGTAKTKTRGEVKGGGKKPWRQKGTGRARHGSIRSPIWKGGGVVFGPVPRSFYHSLPKKERRQSMLLALADKMADQSLSVVDTLDLTTPKTKEAASVLKTLGVGEDQKILCVTAGKKESIIRAFSNLPLISVKPVNEITPYLLLKNQVVIFEKAALLTFLEVYGGER